ncbi:MAG: hypothetical protein HY331_02830, partial [Chloroflexi bacterium]|nr:hypothetical protein [Chloroflexota bacterium]
MGKLQQPFDKQDPPAADRVIGLLSPGDIIQFWVEGTRIVSTVLNCQETIGARTYGWQWSFLDDGTLVEHSADGEWRYREHEVIPQGSSLYEELVAPDGLLVQFEERVRAGTSGRQPVFVHLRDRVYRIANTGTLIAQRSGAQPTIEPWQAFSPDPKENVYFGLVNTEDDEDGVLGIWTSHVCLSFGRPINPT